jgi:hypothetical protein
MRHIVLLKKIPAGRVRTGRSKKDVRPETGSKLAQAGTAVKTAPGPCRSRNRVLDSHFRYHEGAPMSDQRTVNIEIGDKEWEGVYANFVIITHSGSEFVLDFARMLPGAQKAKVFSRIITTPQHAKALMGTLEQNIKRYEADHGEIKLVPNDMPRGPIGFQVPKKD